MTRARLAALAVAAALAAACGTKSTAPSRSNFRLPSAVAAFTGRTVGSEDAAARTVYFAVANEARDDLSLVDARTNEVLDAPVALRPLAVTFPGRPTQLAAASLGDAKPDLLVGVPAGSSALQVVSTWLPRYVVDPADAVELGGDVLALVALPSDGTPGARLAVALAGNRLAVVRFVRRAADDGVQLDASYGTGGIAVHAVGVDAAALAAMPGDANHVYAATLDPIGTAGVLGVAELDVSPTATARVRALDARGPTRLVAAARLGEALTATAQGEAAFAGQPEVPRVYAVLDESGCGPGRRIECGVVALDPAKAPAAGDDHIPDDWAGVMPYRAPIPTRGRALALAVSGPPAQLPSDATWSAGYMRFKTADATTVITTAVGAVATESRVIDFLDLGRFTAISTSNTAKAASATVATEPPTANRLWLKRLAGTDFAPGLAALNASWWEYLTTTPGYARTETWTVAYQPALPQLQNRVAEAWGEAGAPILALQIGEGTPGTARPPGSLARVARLYHPDLGVRVGDIVAVQARSFRVGGVSQCEGRTPADAPSSTASTAPKEFEVAIAELLAPSARAPGGAVRLDLADDASLPAEWQACRTRLREVLTAGTALQGLVVTLRAQGLLLTGATLGYAGRPTLGATYALQYRAEDAAATVNEDTLAAACPLAEWDGTFVEASPPPACVDAACRDACEAVVLARKARRIHHPADDCTTAEDADSASCRTRYPSAFPLALGPTLRFKVDMTDPAAAILRSELTLTLNGASGVVPLAAGPGGSPTQASGAVAFDRSPLNKDDGYRFLVWYPGNQVVDVSPHVYQPSVNLVR